MLEGPRTTPRNRYTFTVVIDNALMSSEWEGARNISSSHEGVFAKNYGEARY